MARAKLSYSKKLASTLGSKEEIARETSFSISKQERRRNQLEIKHRSECRFLSIAMQGAPPFIQREALVRAARSLAKA